MGEINRKKRHIVLTLKRKRHYKIKKLLQQYQAADARQREHIAAKIQRLSPWHRLP